MAIVAYLVLERRPTSQDKSFHVSVFEIDQNDAENKYCDSYFRDGKILVMRLGNVPEGNNDPRAIVVSLDDEEGVPVDEFPGLTYRAFSNNAKATAWINERKKQWSHYGQTVTAPMTVEEMIGEVGMGFVTGKETELRAFPPAMLSFQLLDTFFPEPGEPRGYVAKIVPNGPLKDLLCLLTYEPNSSDPGETDGILRVKIIGPEFDLELDTPPT